MLERSRLSKELKGKNVEEIILSNNFWENAATVLKMRAWIVDELCIVDGDKPFVFCLWGHGWLQVSYCKCFW